MLWLALQFPHLGLEVWDQGRAAAEGAARPTVLIEQNRIVLCDESARMAGIQPGASLATAHSIASALVHFQRDAARERSRLMFLGQALYRFSAQVSLEAPDALLLEVGGSRALFGDPAGLARQASTLCHSLGHETRWQLAATPGAALAMATSGAKRLEEVPLADARLPDAHRHLERLANMGLNSLGALLELPDAELGRRFGKALVGHLARLVGREPEPRRFIEPASLFDQSIHLLEPLKDREMLLADRGPMQHLLVDLEHWLISRQLGAEQLTWSFSSHAGDDRVVVPVSFARALQSHKAFLNVIRLRFERVSLPEEVLTIRLEAHRLQPWLGGSHSLFRQLVTQQTDGELTNTDANELIDQLRARLGSGACSRIRSIDQHAPESAWRTVSASVTGHPAAAGAAAASIRPSDRPLWLFDPPLPTERNHLELLRGPERIQTAWWQQAIWRDYYVADLKTGARCWAFVDARNQWYLHGYFG